MGKFCFIIFKVLLILLMQRCSVTNAIKCFECGILSIIPREENDTNSDCSRIDPMFKSEIDFCSYDLDVKYSTGILQTEIELTQYEFTQAVCYSLWGTFRGQSIIMRGCDALPLPLPSNSNDSNDPYENEYHCFNSTFKVWFETEAGKEYITDHRFCACNIKDLCNVDYSSSALRKSSVTLVLLFVINFYL